MYKEEFMKALMQCYMSVIALCITGAAIVINTGCAGPDGPPEGLEPPVAKRVPKELVKHGHVRQDPYYWLNDREDPGVIAYLEAENEYKDAMLRHTEKLQNKLFNEMKKRIKKDDSSVPYPDNGYYYYARYEKGGEYPVFARKKGSVEAEEEVMLNVNDLAKGYAYYRATGLEVSPDNRYLVFGVDTVSRRKYTIQVKDLETGKMLADRIPNTTGSAVWAADNKTLFYVTKDSTLRPHKIWRHTLGTDPAEDVLIHHESDNTFTTYVTKSKSDRFIYIVSGSTMSSEYRILPADDPNGSFKLFQKRGDDYQYRIADAGDRFFILTNYKAKNFRIMQTPIDRTEQKYWEERIGHRDDVLVQGMEVFNEYLVLNERANGLVQLRIMHLPAGSEHYIEFEEPAYYAGIAVNEVMDTNEFRYTYTSMTTPFSTFAYNMETSEKTLLKMDEVVGGFDPADYRTERLFAEADDGTKVPVSIVYKKDFPRDGSGPLLLYGYGSYGYSMEATFSSARLSLLDRGFAYAIAHVRGGQEMGRYWYEDGKLEHKRNTFTDFIDCAEFLVAEKYTSPDRLFAMGGSAGGLLMGAVVNMAPDLFKGVVAAVPFVDVVTTMLDESITLTTGEYDEWGNPNIKKYYDYMLSYSPYDNVTAQDYPALLVTTGLHDSQVQYWEPAKWVARLRHMKTGDAPVLLHINMDYGHGGASGRFKRLRDTAMEYAFFLDLAGR